MTDKKTTEDETTGLETEESIEENMDEYPEEAPDDTASEAPSAEELSLQLAEKNAELQDRLLRSAAEVENVRNQAAKRLQESRDYAIVSFAKELLPVIDNLTMAIDGIDSNKNDEEDSLTEGVKMTLSELKSIFTRNGIKTIEPKSGDKFDFNLHNAISQIPSEELPSNSIAQVMQTGYQIRDRLLRPASVIVVK